VCSSDLLGIILNVIANRQVTEEREALKEGRKLEPATVKTMTQFWNVYPELASATLNLASMKGTADLLETIQSKDYDRWLARYFQTAASIPIPNTLSAINRARQVYLPELDSKDPVKRFENFAKAKLMMTEDLPLKRDLFGRPIPATPEGADPWVYNFLDVTKSRNIPSDPVIREIYDLYTRTQEGAVIPSQPGRRLTLPGREDSVDLDDRQYERYLELVGKARLSKMEALIKRADYRRTGDAGKIKLISAVYEGGLTKGKLAIEKEL
jgi:hypothetical protein